MNKYYKHKKSNNNDKTTKTVKYENKILTKTVNTKLTLDQRPFTLSLYIFLSDYFMFRRFWCTA